MTFSIVNEINFMLIKTPYTDMNDWTFTQFVQRHTCKTNVKDGYFMI